MLDNLGYSLFLNKAIMKKCTSCTTGNHHILRYLFGRSLTTILLVDGLDVKRQQNGLFEIFFCETTPKRKRKQKKWSKITRYTFAVIHLDFLGKSIEVAFSSLQKMHAKFWVLYWNLTTTDTGRSLIWFKNCSNTAFRSALWRNVFTFHSLFIWSFIHLHVHSVSLTLLKG